MALLILASHPALGVTWTSPPGAFTGFGMVFDRQTPGGEDLYQRPATVTISYNTTGPLDLALSVVIGGHDFSVVSPDGYGYITWLTNYLSFTANNPLSGGLLGESMEIDFTNPGIPRVPGLTVPPSLDGLSTYLANGSGQTNPTGHGWQVF
jgi:hypothetical protein